MSGVLRKRFFRENKIPLLRDSIGGTSAIEDSVVLYYRSDGNDGSLVFQSGTEDYRSGPDGGDIVSTMFDGSTYYRDSVLGPEAVNNLGDRPFAVEFWVNTLDKSGFIPFFDTNGATSNKLTIGMNSNGNAYMVIAGNTRGTAADLADGVWHHVVMLFRNDATTINVQYYVDGVFDRNYDTPVSQYDMSGNTNNSWGSNNNNTLFVNAAIDGFRIYNRQLTTLEIAYRATLRFDLQPEQLDLSNYYDSQDQTTITAAAGLVSQWDDKGPTSDNFTQGTGSLQFTTGSSKINNMNVMLCNNDYMLTAQSKGIRAAYFVLQDDSGAAAANKGLYACGDVPQTFMRVNNTSGNDISVSMVSSQSLNLNDSNRPLATPYLLGYYTDGSMGYLRINGVTTNTDTYEEPPTNANGILSLGGNRFGGTTFGTFVGLLGDVAMSESFLTVDDVYDLEGALAWRFFPTSDRSVGNPNLPVGHKWKLKPPPKFNGSGWNFLDPIDSQNLLYL